MYTRRQSRSLIAWKTRLAPRVPLERRVQLFRGHYISMAHLRRIPRHRGDPVHLLPDHHLTVRGAISVSRPAVRTRTFTPPVSILKPIRGIDPDAYENLASFCRQDYPDYEIVFCVDPDDEAMLSRRLRNSKPNFPQRRIRVLYGSGRVATNDKVAKLARLVSEAAHEVVVISDSDVRVRPDYLRHVMAPLRDTKVGAVTCLYVPTEITTFTDHLQSVGMMSDFYAGSPGRLAIGRHQVRARPDHRHHAHAARRIRRLCGIGEPPGRRSAGRAA